MIDRDTWAISVIAISALIVGVAGGYVWGVTLAEDVTYKGCENATVFNGHNDSVAITFNDCPGDPTNLSALFDVINAAGDV